MQRVSNNSFSVTLGDFRLKVAKATLSIEDGRKAVDSGGVPDGYVDGEVSASGELELDSKNFAYITQAAREAGSYQGIPPLDLLFYAKPADGDEDKVQAFGCLLNIKDIMSVDGKGGEKHLRKVGFEVTSPDFVRINGISYLSPDRVDGLLK